MERSGIDELLRPSLTADTPLQPIYSPLVGYLTSFFGGAMAGALVTAANARRLGRLKQDAWLVALGFIVAIALLSWQVFFDGNTRLDTAFGPRTSRLAPRILGLLYFLVTMVHYRPVYRNMSMAGIDAPSGWRIGLVAFVVSTLIYVPLLAIMLAVR